MEFHPGEIKGERVSFFDFEPFIKTGNIPLEVNKKFNLFLQELFRKTWTVWIPGSCYSTQYLERESKKILNDQKIKGMAIEPRSYAGGGHFWLAAKFECLDKELVVDPTGVPEVSESVYMRKPELITPFFGDPNLSSKFHQMVYQKGELDTTYHTFHP